MTRDNTNNCEVVSGSGSFQAELDGILGKLYEQCSPEAMETLVRDIDSWKHTTIVDGAPKIDECLPDFVLEDEKGGSLCSEDLRAQGPVVVLFFRGSWCPFCNHTLKMLRKYTPHFRARGASVVAISGQNLTTSRQTVVDASLNVPVLSDLGHVYAQRLGIAYVLSEKMKHVYEDFGVDFQKVNGEETGILPIPATFVIDTNGKILFSHVEVDFTKRADPVEILNVLPPLQSSRKQSLENRMEMEYAKMLDNWTKSKHQRYIEAIQLAHADGGEHKALQKGEKAPDFSLLSKDGTLVSSRKLRRKGPLVVMFNWGIKNPLCKLQMELMERYRSKFTKKGANVVVITPGQANSKCPRIDAVFNSTFPMLTDTTDNAVAKQFKLLNTWPGHVAGFDEDDLMELPMVATYVIDRSGQIVSSFVSVDPRRRPEPSDVLQRIPAKFQRRSFLKWGLFSSMAHQRLKPNVQETKSN